MKASPAMSASRSKLGPAPDGVAAMSRNTSSSTSWSLKMRTALIGSPTYFASLNFTVLTRPPLRSSRQGMTRVRSICGRVLEPGEIVEERHAEAMALLGVKLRAPDVAAMDHRREVD